MSVVLGFKLNSVEINQAGECDSDHCSKSSSRGLLYLDQYIRLVYKWREKHLYHFSAEVTSDSS